VTDYTEFDKRLISVVRRGFSTFIEISHGELRKYADALAAPDRYGWRVIDRRLQALRKRGALTYSRETGWEVAKEPK
jgi:hypothetical protein